MSHDSEIQGELRSARSFTREIAPHWQERFARSLFRRALPQKKPARVLDIHCAHAHTTTRLLESLHPESQVLALQADPALFGVAQSKLLPHKRRVHLREGNFDLVTTFPDQQFEFICANLVLGQSVPDWQQGLSEIHRLLAPGGQARASLALAGTWSDATQIVLRVLKSHGAHWAHEQLLELESKWPTPQALLATLGELVEDPGDIDLEVDRFELLFSNARDFFRAALVETGPLAIWRALLKHQPDPGAMLWHFREAFDAYYEGHVLALPVVVGVATMRKNRTKRKRNPLSHEALASFPQLRRLCFGRERSGELPLPPLPASESHNPS